MAGGVLDSTDLCREAAAVLDLCRNHGLRLVTVESCTGGLIAAALTAVPGSSDVVERGFVTYSNDAKTELVGIPMEMIARHGAVSAPVAHAMALGGLAHSLADIAVSVTGVAGPGGGSAVKPVGLVYLAAARRDGDVVDDVRRFGDIGRDQIRHDSVMRAFALIHSLLEPAL